MQGRGPKSLQRFVSDWGELESLCIATFKAERFSAQDAQSWSVLRKRITRAYGKFEHDLRPYWAAVKVEGQIVQEDPFRRILSVEALSDVVGNWSLMQQLPAAREALNHFILKKTS